MMKRRRSGKRALALMLLVLVLSIVMSGMTVAAAKPKVRKKKMTLTVGKSVTLKLKNVPKAQSRKIKWKTSNKNVAVVSKKGKVTAKNAGKAVITAIYKNKKYSCKVTVKAAEKPAAPVKEKAKPSFEITEFSWRAVEYQYQDTFVTITTEVKNTSKNTYLYESQPAVKIRMYDDSGSLMDTREVKLWLNAGLLPGKTGYGCHVMKVDYAPAKITYELQEIPADECYLASEIGPEAMAIASLTISNVRAEMEDAEYDFDLGYRKDLTKTVKAYDQLGSMRYKGTIKNTGAYDFTVGIMVVYRDAAGKIVGSSTIDPNMFDAGSENHGKYFRLNAKTSRTFEVVESMCHDLEFTSYELYPYDVQTIDEDNPYVNRTYY
ncbi:MAG: Ig-like domain-containing protein [Eubacteriales bacterium]|nr:Ig-like domain-containing protein [Eubacteriales bacterium]